MVPSPMMAPPAQGGAASLMRPPRVGGGSRLPRVGAPLPAPTAGPRPTPMPAAPPLAAAPTTPAPAPMAPAPLPAAPGATLTGFGPGQDLRSTAITPGASPLTTQAAGAVSGALGGLTALPDRSALAQQKLAALGGQLDDQRRTESRQIGQQAAALGRVGSGMTTSEFGDLDARLDLQRTRGANDIALQAAEGETADRMARLTAGQSVYGQAAGLDAEARSELRTERGYQGGAEQQAYDRQRDQTTLGDSLQTSALARALALWSAGQSSGNLGGALGQGAQTAGQAGAGAMGAGAGLLGQWAYLQAMQRGMGGQGGQGYEVPSPGGQYAYGRAMQGTADATRRATAGLPTLPLPPGIQQTPSYPSY